MFTLPFDTKEFAIKIIRTGISKYVLVYLCGVHNILAIVLVRVPGAYLTSIFFPDTLYPMGLSTSAASLVSVIICVVAYLIITRRPRTAQTGGSHGT